MKRMHLFEFEDLPAFPKSLRLYITDTLAFFLNTFKTYDKAIKVLGPVVKAARAKNILDMCSGSGGPVKRLLWLLHGHGIHALQKVTLSDKYASGPGVESFDVLKDKHPDASFRTMFSAFHHFRPDQCRAILRNTVQDRATVVICEFNERSMRGLLFMLVGIPICFVCAPFMKPFRWSRLLWTYLVPIGPVVLLWDGIVSSLRTYSGPELLDLASEQEGYFWESGYLDISPVQKITYLVGVPITEGLKGS